MRNGIVPLIICGVAVYFMLKPLYVFFPEGAYFLLGAYALTAVITLGGMGIRAARRRRRERQYYRRY